MAFVVSALIAAHEPLAAVDTDVLREPVVLEQGFGLRATHYERADQSGFLWLTKGVAASASSLNGRVVYVEADMFGGVGDRAAAAWVNGERVPLPDGDPLNAALEWLGVERGEAFDEFEAVGLDGRRMWFYRE